MFPSPGEGGVASLIARLPGKASYVPTARVSIPSELSFGGEVTIPDFLMLEVLDDNCAIYKSTYLRYSMLQLVL